ncbi:hypothetical protein MUP01_04925 [Candidatus Bathyarchaeota archaeon]|nr:hypothetical protein [Candidatus Bathyarchaeota archaeon]
MGLMKTLAEVIGIIMVIVGIILFAVGIYGLAGGTGVTFTINDRVVSAQEGGQVFAIAGIVALLIGAVLSYVGFKRMQ